MKFPDTKEQEIALHIMEAVGNFDPDAFTAGFVAYWIDPEHKCLDRFPVLKSEVVQLSSDREAMEQSLRDHEEACGKKNCDLGMALTNCVAWLNKEPPTMVEFPKGWKFAGGSVN